MAVVRSGALTLARTAAALGSVVLTTLALTACGGAEPVVEPTSEASPSSVPTALTEARGQLAGLAAAAKDKRMVAFYLLRTPERPDRTVAVTLATDGSWRVDVPGGAHGGAVDVAMSATPDGQVFQCALPSTSYPQGQCVKVGDADHAVPAKVDPRVQHAFTDWLDVLIDRRAALSVANSTAPPGVAGSCFSLELTAASLVTPIDAGIYCYAPDGTLTGLVASFGELVLTGTPSPGLPTVPLPAPIVPGPALSTTAPPPPPSPTVSPSIRR